MRGVQMCRWCERQAKRTCAHVKRGFKDVMVDAAYTKLISPNPHEANRETLTLAFACVKRVEE